MQPENPRSSSLDAELALLREQAAYSQAEVVRRTQDLQKSEAMLLESQRLARIGSFELEVATGQLTWSEQQFHNFGMEPTAKVDRALVITRIHPLDLGRHEAVVKRSIAHGEAFAIDYRVIHPDGKVLDLHTIGQPVVDAAGRVLKIVGTSQDVSARRRLEDQLREQYAQLVKLGELKSNFVNSVAHELRTPLTTILGYAEFLQEASTACLPLEQRLHVGQIQRGAKRIEFLLNDLLDFACMEAGTFTLRCTPTSLGDRARDVVASLRPQAEEAQLTLKLILADSLPELKLDAQRIGQVLTNLIYNAIKFSPRGGTVSVKTFQRGRSVRCEIADAGPGIEAADLPRLFQRFSQLEPGIALGKGTGLGLSISKALVEAHGGTIGIESTPGAGSTFWFELPIKPTLEAFVLVTRAQPLPDENPQNTRALSRTE